jgi:hypothetical protein
LVLARGRADQLVSNYTYSISSRSSEDSVAQSELTPGVNQQPRRVLSGGGEQAGLENTKYGSYRGDLPDPEIIKACLLNEDDPEEDYEDSEDSETPEEDYEDSEDSETP